MNDDELARIWKETIVDVLFLEFAWRDSGRQRKSSIRITSIAAKIESEELPDASLECYL
jgi:hypothetical protein